MGLSAFKDNNGRHQAPGVSVDPQRDHLRPDPRVHAFTDRSRHNGRCRKTWYEVFERKINAARSIGDTNLPASEAFPSDEAFGKWAWTFPTAEQCLEKSEFIDSRVESRKAP